MKTINLFLPSQMYGTWKEGYGLQGFLPAAEVYNSNFFLHLIYLTSSSNQFLTFGFKINLT